MIVLAAALLAFVLVPTQADNDLWGHLRFGLDILETHSVPTVDHYSFTEAGAPWIDDEWLSEALYALLWKAWGAAGLVTLKIALALLTGILCYWHLASSGVSSARTVLVLPMLALLLPPFFMVRPLEFTIPAFAFTLIVIYRVEHGASAAALWALPPVYALWVNLHGGLLAGLAILGMWAAARAVVHREWLQAGLPVAATFASISLTPYGWRLPVFLFHAVSAPRPEIVEWEPLRITSPYGAMYAAVLALSIAGLILSRMEKSPWLLAIFGITSLLPFAALRHAPLSAIAAVVLAGPHVGDMWKRIAEGTRPPAGRSMFIPGWAPLLPLICAAAFVMAAVRQPMHISVSNQYPVKAANFLSASGIEGDLIHRFNWGEYLLWRLEPRMKVMIDGRRETVYSDDVYQRCFQFQTGTGDWDSLIRQYRPDVALLEKDSVSANLFRLKTDWAEVYQDDVAVIFVRRDTAAADRLARTARTNTRASESFQFP